MIKLLLLLMMRRRRRRRKRGRRGRRGRRTTTTAFIIKNSSFCKRDSVTHRQKLLPSLKVQFPVFDVVTGPRLLFFFLLLFFVCMYPHRLVPLLIVTVALCRWTPTRLYM